MIHKKILFLVNHYIIYRRKEYSFYKLTLKIYLHFFYIIECLIKKNYIEI